MIPEERIDTDRLYLRALEESDASERYAAWLNDPIVNRYLETRSVTIADMRRYIQEKRESPTALFLGIFVREEGDGPASPADAQPPFPASPAGRRFGSEAPANSAGRHIGNVKLEPIDAGKATMGILIGDKDFWGKGIATEVTNLVTEYAFGALGLREVNLGVIAEHKAAIRVYEKCGFVAERIEKDAINHDGELFDQVYMVKNKIESRN